MRKSAKILFFIIASFLIIALSLFLTFLALTKNTYLDEKKLISLDKTVAFFDKNGRLLSERSNKNTVTEISAIPDYTKNAFIAIEDKRFYNHNGVDIRGLFRAGISNLKSFSFKEGASTISQQLIKNTHLSGEKTVKRKLTEIKLALKLEKKYTKDQILEMYLNTIYFGDNCYGITNASKRYFSKKPSELSINESAILAGLIKAPSNYSPLVDKDKCFNRKNIVLDKMYEQGYLTKTEYERSLKEEVLLNPEKNSVFDYTYIAQKEFNQIMENARYLGHKFKVYTYCDNVLENEVQKTAENISDSYNKSIVLTDKNSNLIAYTSNCGEVMRQLGSTIKPLAVYAPAIETDTVYSCTLLNDEKTDFNGYSPSNYNDKYYGNISVKDSLAKSSNVCAVKLLNYTGVEKSIDFLKKTEIMITENDNSLALALGATEKGSTLTQIVSAYSVFLNEGNYFKFNCIDRIEDENGKLIYHNYKKKNKIFSNETVTIMNEMLNNTVKNGTAKKLSFMDLDIYAKTGTVGNKNGNTDAYTISYTSDHVLGVWVGNKENSLLDNTVTGGTLPAETSKKVWDSVYDKGVAPKPIKNSEKVIEVNLDLISYNENKIELADNVSPERYKFTTLMKNTNMPKTVSTRFSKPKIDTPIYQVNNNGFSLRLCQVEYYNIKVYRECDGKKICVYDTLDNKNKYEFIDKSLTPNKSYKYSVVPYYFDGQKTYDGEEIILPTIKKPSVSLGKDWWLDEFD